MTLRDQLAARESVKGEVVLVVGGATEGGPEAAHEDPRALFERLVAQGLTRRAAVKEVARLTGRPAREVYALVLPD